MTAGTRDGPPRGRGATGNPAGRFETRAKEAFADGWSEADAEPRGFFNWFPRNPVAANILMLVFLVGGALTLFGGRLKTEVFPEIRPNMVTVAVVYPGATPAEVEQGALSRIEEAVAGVTGVDKITSTANEGSGSVMVEALVNADLVQVFNDVKNRVDAITSFPDEVEQPTHPVLVLA